MSNCYIAVLRDWYDGFLGLDDDDLGFLGFGGCWFVGKDVSTAKLFILLISNFNIKVANLYITA